MEATDTEYIQSLYCRRELSEIDPNFDNSSDKHLIFESLFNDDLIEKVLKHEYHFLGKNANK